ncbi:MAG: hypothetical protein KME38_26745 [Spirirestis rafaelensis WJT71-NPBG6]|nr:hypothetical protein [Spirirestis rafaelensis WJT71-NPBG6]
MIITYYQHWSMGNIGLHGTNCIYKKIFLQPCVVSPNKAEGILEQGRSRSLQIILSPRGKRSRTASNDQRRLLLRS